MASIANCHSKTDQVRSERGEGVIFVFLIVFGLAVAYFIFMGVLDYIQYVKEERGKGYVPTVSGDPYGYRAPGDTQYTY